MEALLDYSTNPWVIGGIFLATLALLHWLFVYRFPLNQAQWKLSEYVWLGLALLSIIGVLEEARFLRSGHALEQSRIVAEEKLRAIERWFEVYSLYACEENGVSDNATQLCRWAKLKNSELRLVLTNEEFPADIPENLLVGLDAIEDGINATDRSIIRQNLSGYIEARGRYLAAVSGADRSMLSIMLVSLAPVLFALAVGLRFAKATGEYRNLRRGR